LNIPQIAAASFTDAQGAAVTVPAERVGLYVGIKTDQLAALTSLIADARAGYQIELGNMDLVTFEALASELAHTAKAVVASFAYGEIFAKKAGE
jgi:hypothetical protein